MIIRHDPETLTLVTQPDHAAMAARVMGEWRAGGLPSHPRRASILRAVAEHDNGWREIDASPIVDPSSGGLLDFVRAPMSTRQSVWPRAIARLADDPWTAALVAHHAWYVYGRLRADPAWVAFFASMTALRAQYLDRSAASDARLDLAALEADYAFVRLGDLISLVFCDRWTDPQVDFGYRIRRDGTTVVVAPDPFAGSRVSIEVPARVVPNRPFANADDAGEVLARAACVALDGAVVGEA